MSDDQNAPLYPGATDTRYHRLYIQRTKTWPLRYEIRQATRSHQPGDVLCYAQGRLGQVRRSMNFYADEARTTPMFSYRARYPVLTKNTFDILDTSDGPLGWFAKDLGKSFFNATITFASYRLEGLGKDTQLMENRFKKILDYGGSVRFSFVLPNIKDVMTVRRGYGEHDPYFVDIVKQNDGRQLDWRVGAAIAVGMDHMLNHMRG